MLLIEVGSVVNDRYQIKEVVKQSQFEAVYLVEDKLRSNESFLLTKLVPIHPIAESLFQRELESLISLKHPQIQESEDFFWQNEQLFIVQNYVAGQTYQNWLLANTLTEQQATQLLNQLLLALSYLHSQQVTHKDISPNNILLRSIDNAPLLTNFSVLGDIKARMGLIATESKLVDQIKQLPIGFIAPGMGEDLYALAVTVVILLTGQDIKVLFNYQAQSWDWERWKLVSDRTADVLNQMLATQVTDRFPSAEAALQALNSTSSPKTTYIPAPPFPTPVAAISPTQFVPQQKVFSKKSSLRDWQKAVIAGGVVGVLVVGGLWLWKEKQPIVAIAPLSSQQSIPAFPVTSPTPEIATESQNIAPLPVITKGQAVALVKEWQKSKRQIFAAPFNRQLGFELTTGEAYRKNFGANGSIDWLENNNSYYRYGVQSLDSIGNFYSSGDRATIEVVITENRILYKGSRIDRRQTALDTRLVRYSLQLEDGRLKISDYDTLKKIR